MAEYWSPLRVTIAWHGKAPDSQAMVLAKDALKHFMTDQAEEGTEIGVPVTLAGLGDTRPRPELNASDSLHAVVLLIDDEMFAARDRGWRELIAELCAAREKAPDRLLLLPVEMTPTQADLSDHLKGINNIPLHSFQGDSPWLFVQLDLALTRFLRLSEAELSASWRPPVFLSHRKEDGEADMLQLRRYLSEKTQLDVFYDRMNIPHGGGFEAYLHEAIRESLVLVFLTSEFMSSEWCEWEVKRAGALRRPIVVVDATQPGFLGLPPELQHAPVVPWKQNYEEVGQRVAREYVRSVFRERLLQRMKMTVGSAASRVHIQSHKPDAIQVRQLGAGDTLLYPDPPLRRLGGDSELAAGAKLRSAAQFLSFGLPGPSPSVVISASNPKDDPNAMERVGLTSEHIDACFREIARWLLASGARLRSGGDFRSDGIVRCLLAFARGYLETTPQDHLVTLVREEVESQWSHEVRREWQRNMAIELVEDRTLHESDELRLALRLTDMRMQLIRDSVAFVAIGGCRFGTDGFYPGTMEEVWLALTERPELPVFLLGGFGGCVRDIVSVIRGESVSSLTLAKQLEEQGARGKVYRERLAYLNREGKGDIYQFMRETLAQIGLLGLADRCGLSRSQLNELLGTVDPYRVTALIRTGLKNYTARN